MSSQQMKSNKTLVAKLMSGRTGSMKSYVAILLVSVGKENFEEDALKAAVKMINQEFKSCCIAIADTLQRYNIATEKKISPEDAYNDSLLKGDEWLSKYKDFLDNAFNIPYEVLRWDALITHPKFKEKQQRFISLFAEDQSLLDAMDESIDEYGKRVEKRLSPDHVSEGMQQHRNNCFSYLQEECAAISLLPEAIHLIDTEVPATIVYPGRPTPILTANRNLFLKGEFCQQMERHEDYMNWLPYRFNKVKSNSKTLSSVSTEENSTKTKQNKLSELIHIDYVNYLTEAQFYSLHELLDEASIYEFNDHVLEFLLEHNFFFHAQSSICSSTSQKMAPKSLAYIFSKQMMAMFMALDQKIANQCKANIIRIAKRMNANKFSQNEKGLA